MCLAGDTAAIPGPCMGCSGPHVGDVSISYSFLTCREGHSVSPHRCRHTRAASRVRPSGDRSPRGSAGVGRRVGLHRSQQRSVLRPHQRRHSGPHGQDLQGDRARGRRHPRDQVRGGRERRDRAHRRGSIATTRAVWVPRSTPAPGTGSWCCMPTRAETSTDTAGEPGSCPEAPRPMPPPPRQRRRAPDITETRRSQVPRWTRPRHTAIEATSASLIR